MELRLGEQLIETAKMLPELSLLISFIAPFVGGEAAILTLGFFAGKGLFPLLGVISGSFLGMMTLDSFWFLVMRSGVTKKLRNRIEISQKYINLEARIEKFSHRNDIIILLISKILIGTRVLVLAYISIRKISFRKFALANGAANLTWAIILGYLGWFAGLGFWALETAKYGVVVGGLYLVGAAVTIYGSFWLIRKWLAKK